MMAFAVDIQQVEKRYGSFTALAGVSLTLEQGEFFALLGPNGAGKTTLISALAGLTRVNAGTLSVMGHDVQTDYQAARKALGIVPQEIVFDPFFSVRETLRFQAGYFGIPRSAALDAWIDELLTKLSLADKADKNMRQLSGGMKRRVLVAQALVHRPPVIVLDEPTAGVDVELRQTLWSFIRELNAQGHTILLTTHYLEEAQQLCTRIAMLKQGKIVAMDTTEHLLNAFSERVLKVKLAADLPHALLPNRTRQEDAWHHFSIHDYQEVERLLARLRESGAQITNLEVTEPELEAVFVKIMQQGTGE
ncbi:MAG: ABC transporter ATP-binding protein [Betaproteobacteria bacterium]|nr:ABC transporter ATP-binding protein [Betaproteobacteria bacterium]